MQSELDDLIRLNISKWILQQNFDSQTAPVHSFSLDWDDIALTQKASAQTQTTNKAAFSIATQTSTTITQSKTKSKSTQASSECLACQKFQKALQ